MRKDLGFYLEADIVTVYNAYLKTLMAPPFGRSCKEEPYHTLTFGLNFSVKYNMNGGSCHVHFMPYKSGTAVNIRFVLAQAAAARYGRYAEELHRNLVHHLQVTPVPASYNMDDFLRPENRVFATSTPAPVVEEPVAAPVAPTPVVAEPVAVPAPTPVVAEPVAVPEPAPVVTEPVTASATTARFCGNCGAKLEANLRFCTQCGMPVSKPKVCPNCNTPAKEADRFCGNCGTKL